VTYNNENKEVKIIDPNPNNSCKAKKNFTGFTEKNQEYCNLYLSGRIAVLGRQIIDSWFIMQVCGGYDREDRMLLCDGCDQG